MATKKPKARTKSRRRTQTLYFTASWCGPCQAMHRLLHKHPDLLALIEIVDIDENVALAEEYGIRAVPTLVRPDGERVEGSMGLRELRAFLAAEG